MEKKLAKNKCQPCSTGALELKDSEIKVLLSELQKGWKVIDGEYLERKIDFPDFAAGLSFTMKLGEIAEEQGHHPNIYLTYSFVTVTIWTHKIDTLSKNDFILAAKFDELLSSKA